LTIFYFFRSLDFAIIFSLVPYFENVTVIILGVSIQCLDIITCFLFLGSMGKSAQLGLHTWLPDAMEGPTPVSALIHAATLVTAGVFLIIRCSALFEFAKVTLIIIMFVGGLTAFFAASVAITQDDIKKVIAYSTCSQLGYMIFICGLSEYNLSMFHLVNHAFFKALLFLAAGSVIHSVSGEQDMRKFGKLTKFIPFTYSVLFLGFLALSGFPFLSGFYSKDFILEMSFSKQSVGGIFSY
jgi:NADH:ubiquinone oxidoreductase subunit 5 (subunit L)/multisubunit Na+/H+ antiporter MnhA subunit